MHHFFEAITNRSGDSMIGYFGRVVDPATLATVTIASDNNGTPIFTVSGVENMAKTDENGNISLYVAPGTYHLDIYQPDATTFIMRVPNVAMNSSKGDQGDIGPVGPPGEGLADVMAPNGAALVGFLPDGVGAVVQTVAARARQEMLLSDFLPEGFVVTGGTDYTAEIQAAFNSAVSFNRTLKIIPGVFDHNGLTAPATLNVVGQGQYTSIFRSLSGGSFTLTGELCSFSDIGIIGQGGHLVKQSSNIGRNIFNCVNFLQGSDGFSVFDNMGFASIRNVFYDCYAQHTLTATVPTFNMVGLGGEINNNMWVSHWAQTSGNYHINIETTNDNAQYGNVVKGYVGEVGAGGGIRMAGAKQFILEDIHCWDVSLAPGGKLLKDFIRIERGRTGAYPDAQRATSLGKIDGYTRLDSGIEAGVVDISLPDGGGGSGIEISNISSASDSVLINLRGNRIYAVIVDSVVTLQNREGATTFDPITGIWRWPDFARLQIGGEQVIGQRVKGFGGVVGTSDKGVIATYDAPVASATYDQAQMQALMNAMQERSRLQKAHSDALFAHGIIGA